MRKANADDRRQAAELIEFDSGDLRREPLEARSPGLRLNELIEADGPNRVCATPEAPHRAGGTPGGGR